MEKNRNKNKNKQTHPRTLEDSPSPDPWFLSVGPTEILKLWRLGVPLSKVLFYNFTAYTGL